MQNVVDYASLRLTAAGLTRTDTVVLLHLDSNALEHKVYAGYIQARTASARSRAVVSHGWTCTLVRAVQVRLLLGVPRGMEEAQYSYRRLLQV